MTPLTLIHGLSPGPRKEAGKSVGSKKYFNLVRLLEATHPVSVVAVRNQVELSVAIAGWVWKFGT